MPLRCFDPNSHNSIHAFDLSPDEWRALALANSKGRHLLMPCCKSKVTLKRSRRGTQFFAHKAVGDCSTAEETEAHLRLKQMAVEMARANGWDAATEVVGAAHSGEQWKADVLAQKGGHKVAVEIQWSPQTNDETLRRQQRYAQSGVYCLWLLRQPGFPVIDTLPAARISGTAVEGFSAHIPAGSAEQSFPIHDFLNAWFGERFRFGMPLGVGATVSIRAGHMDCWSCRAETRIITGIDVTVGFNKYEFSVPDLSDYPDLFEAIKCRLPGDLGLGAIKRRFSNALGQPYLSNGCAHCDILIGAHYEIHARYDEVTVCAFPIRIYERWRQAIEGNDGYEKGWSIDQIANQSA